jgi:hypothetical protein
MTSSAAAPSVRGELLPAVTEPCALSNTGRSFASASSEVSGRTMSSVVPVAAVCGRDGDVHHLRVEHALLPRRGGALVRGERDLVLPGAGDVFSPWPSSPRSSPMVRPVEYSAIAGGTGTMSFGLRPAKARSRSGKVLARLALHQGAGERAAGEDRHVAHRLGAAGDGHLAHAESRGRGHVGEGLDGRWRRRGRRCAPRGLRQRGGEADLASDARGQERGNRLAEDDLVDLAGSMSARSTSSRTTAAPRSSEVREPKTPPALTKGVRSPFTTTAREEPG